MRAQNMNQYSRDMLISDFVEIAKKQGEVADDLDTSEYNRLFLRMRKIVEELSRREGDQRSALTTLFTHDNAQVRLAAARNAISVDRGAAVAVLKAIADSGVYPQAPEAGLDLIHLGEAPSPVWRSTFDEP